MYNLVERFSNHRRLRRELHRQITSERDHRDLPHIPLLRIGLGHGRANEVRAPVVLVAEVDDDALLAGLGGRRTVLVLEGVELVEDGRGALGDADEVVVVGLGVRVRVYQGERV